MQVWEKVKCAGCEDVWLSDQDTGTLKHSEEEREIEDGQGMFAEPFGTLCAQLQTTKIDNGNADIWICPYCVESLEMEPLGTIVARGPAFSGKFFYEPGFLLDNSTWEVGLEELHELPDDVREVIRSIVSGSYWKKTDAWRGYFQPSMDSDEWIEVIDTWHSTWDETGFSKRVNDFLESPFCPVVAVFGRTSNVFAISLSIYVPKEYEDSVRELLGEVEHY